jgi:hypothetical protein
MSDHFWQFHLATISRLNEALGPPIIDRQLIQSGASVHQVCLPTVLLWHPLQLLQQVLLQSDKRVGNMPYR